MPHGGIESTCIIQSLHDALASRGPLNSIREIADRVPEHSWLMSYPVSPMPSCYEGIQSAVCKILSLDESCADLNKSLYISFASLLLLMILELLLFSFSVS